MRPSESPQPTLVKENKPGYLDRKASDETEPAPADPCVERQREALALLPDTPDHWDEWTGNVRLTEDQWNCVLEARALLSHNCEKSDG